MATGGPLRRAQVVFIKCELCDKHNEVKWKCLQCQEDMCDDCRITHQRMRATRDHTILVVEEIKDDDKEVTFYCTEHPKELFVMYCVSCDVPLCLECLTKKHQSHMFVKLSKFTEQKKKELSESIKQTNGILSTYNSSLDALVENKKIYSKDIESLIKEIKDEWTEQKMKIEEMINKLIKQLQQLEKMASENLEKTEQSLNEERSKLQHFVTACETKLQSSNNMVVIKYAREAKQKQDQFKPCPPCLLPSPPRFIKGNAEREDFEKIVGHLKKREVTEEKGSDYVDVNRSFTKYDAPSVSSLEVGHYVTRVSSTNKGSIWLGRANNTGKTLTLVTEGGAVQKTVNTDFKFSDVAVCKGELFVTDSECKQIKKLTSNDKFATVQKTSPFTPYGLCDTEDDNLLVGLCNNDNKQGKVVQMTTSGQTVQTIQYDNNNKALFTNPRHVIENINKDICVIDNYNKVVVVDKTGRHRFTYDKVKEDLQFYGITCDNFSNIFLSDKTKKQIHLIDKNGQLIQFILTKEHGIIEYPWGMCFDQQRKLWVAYFTKALVLKF